MITAAVSSVSLPSATTSSPASASSASSMPHNLVSWQSAFIGLITLALNAMTQASGLDSHRSHTNILFPSRSSPFVCLADAVDVIILFCTHISRGCSIRRAVLEVNWQRARYRLGQDVVTLETTQAEKHPMYCVLLFIVALLQAVKLFYFQGTPWTRLWVGFYLSSYVVLALATLLAPKGWRGSPPEMVFTTSKTREPWKKSDDAFSYILLYGSLAAHFLCCSWALDRITSADLRQAAGVAEAGWSSIAGVGWLSETLSFVFTQLGPCLTGSAVASVAIISIYLPAYLLYRILDRTLDIVCLSCHYERPETGFVQLLLQYCSSGPPCAIGSYILVRLMVPGRIYWVLVCRYWESTEAVKVSQGSVVSVLAVFTRGSGYLLMIMFVLWGIKKILLFCEEQVLQLKRIASLLTIQGVFACLTFVVALLYYCFRYESSGTYEPTWADIMA